MNFDVLARQFENGTTPLVRADFSDDGAWRRVVEAVTVEADFGGDGGGTYTPNVTPVEERSFEGATGASLAELSDSEHYGYALLADARSMREAGAGGELTVVYVDLSVDPAWAEEFGDVLGREFRCLVGEFAPIEANLSISNMEFAEFADSADEDGVFRGFDG